MARMLVERPTTGAEGNDVAVETMTLLLFVVVFVNAVVCDGGGGGGGDDTGATTGGVGAGVFVVDVVVLVEFELIESCLDRLFVES